MGGLLSALRWTKRPVDGDWEIVSETPFQCLELYPRRVASDDISLPLKFDQVQVADSIEELAADKTWLLIQRADEEYVMAWSPCSGERLMLSVKLLDQVRAGLFLAAGSGYCALADLVLDYEEQVLYAARRHKGVMWSFSSLTGQWETIDEEGEQDEQDLPVDELGKLYHTFEGFNPKYKAYKPLPSPEQVSVHVLGREWWHSYAGSLYAMGCDRNTVDGSMLVFRWDAANSSWTQIASHAMFSHGEKRYCTDFFHVNGGGRYLWAVQENGELLHFGGRFLVVYDLEKDTWHYHTTQADTGGGSLRVLACTRGSSTSPYFNTAFSAVWSKDDHLSRLLPPLPE